MDGLTIPDGTEIEWTAIDSKGQETTCSFSVFVDPNSIPEDAFAAFELSAFPNPANDLLQLSSNFGIEYVQVQSMDGKMVFSKVFEGELRVQLSTSELTDGAYILTVRTLNGYEKSQLQVISH